MKKQTFTLALLALCTGTALAQNKIKDGTVTGSSSLPNASAVLELESNNRGLLMPRLTGAQMTAIASPANGLLVYNTDSACICQYKNNAWASLCRPQVDSTGNDWHVIGNSLTTPPTAVGTAAGTANYWGTRDAQNLAVATNGVTRAIFDRNGSLYGGNGTFNPALNPVNSLVWGNNHKDSAAYTLVTGNTNTVSTAAHSSAISGETNRVTGPWSLVAGGNNRDSALGSLATGGSNTLGSTASYSAVSGGSNVVTGSHSLISGGNNTVSANYNQISGGSNTVSGSHSLVAGLQNNNSAAYCLVTGNNNILGATATNSAVLGASNVLTGSVSLVAGTNNKDSATSTLVTGNGNTLGAAASHTAVSGYQNAVTGSYSLVAGYQNKDSAAYSFVTGVGNILSPAAVHTAVSGNSNTVTGARCIVGGSGLTATNNNTLYINNAYIPGSIQYGTMTAISDRRFKSNFKALGYGLGTIMKLEPQEYDQVNAYRVANGAPVTTDKGYEGKHHSFGFIAQDLYKVIPEAVKKPVDEQNDNWGVDYVRLVPVLTKAIQELKAENDQLKARLDALEAATKK